MSNLPEHRPARCDPPAVRRAVIRLAVLASAEPIERAPELDDVRRAVIRLAVLAGALLTLQACSLPIEATYRGRIEVWNRTLSVIRIVGREVSFEVPPCGHVTQEQFILHRYDIIDDRGRFIARHGGGGSNPASVIPSYEVITSEGAAYFSQKPPPQPFPECRGVVQGQQ